MTLNLDHVNTCDGVDQDDIGWAFRASSQTWLAKDGGIWRWESLDEQSENPAMCIIAGVFPPEDSAGCGMDQFVEVMG